MAITLPTQRIAATSQNPRFMVLFARPKTGKSTFCASLDNNLILDLENGYEALDAMKIVLTDNKTCIDDLKDVVKQLHAYKKQNGQNLYKYITIDNATRLEERINRYAIQLYRETNLGKNWGYLKDQYGQYILDKNGERQDDPKADIKSLDMGGGYTYIKKAICDVISWFQNYCETIILVCHTKDKNIQKAGSEMNEMSVDLLGKTGDVICSMADAVGFMYRDSEGTHLSFEAGDNVIRGARAEHLRNRDFVVITCDKDNKIVVDNSKIFI